MNDLFYLEQRITHLETTLPGLRLGQLRHPHLASFKTDLHNREFEIANLKDKFQRLQHQMAAGELW
jgi:hypothetical protein